MGVMSELDFTPQSTFDNVDASKPEYQKAIHLHRDIMANIQTAADAMIEFCKSLKEMRDSKLFMELGYKTFEDYTVQAVGLKQRQAYCYISTYEKLGNTFLQSNATLGITKLGFLTAIPAIEREEFVDENHLDGMTVPEVQELVAKYNQATEQLSLLQEEKTQLTESAEDEKAQAQQDKDELLQEIQGLKTQLANLPPDNTEKIRAEEAEKAADQIKQAQKDAADKIKAAKDKAKAAADAAVKAAEEKAKQAQADAEKQAQELAKKQLAESLKDVEQEKADAIARAAELEQKLKVAANKDTVTLNFHLTEMQKQFTSAADILKSIAGADPRAGEKFRGAVIKVLDVMKQRLEDRL